AAAEHGEEESALASFNRDTLVLLFYRPANQAGPAPLAYQSLMGTASFSVVGYPMEIAGVPTEVGRMYGTNLGGQMTFSRDGFAHEYAGRPNALAFTNDLRSGGGQSG